VAAVEAAVEQHPKAHNCRVSVKHDRIEIYEQVGLDLDDLIARFSKKMPLTTGQVERLRESQERSAQFTPVMRFILVNAERRTFCAERWCYLGSIDDWIDVGPMGPVDDLARRLILRSLPEAPHLFKPSYIRILIRLGSQNNRREKREEVSSSRHPD
jgi:hypothetical protein